MPINQNCFLFQEYSSNLIVHLKLKRQNAFICQSYYKGILVFLLFKKELKNLTTLTSRGGARII
jgi:hypothetical protein